MMKNNILSRNVLLVFVFIIFAILILILYLNINPKMTNERASEIFKQFILDPIPESVTDIKADQPRTIRGYRYTFLFNINREDLGLIIDSEPFQKVRNVKYRNGNLVWEWDQGYSETAIIYKGWTKPGWFRPELSENSEVYAFVKIGDQVNIQLFDYKQKAYDKEYMKILIYNPKKGQAYFIASKRNL